MDQINNFNSATNSQIGVDRIAYSVAEAAKVTGLGRTTLFAMIGDGRLPSYKIGNRRLIRRADLEALFYPQHHSAGI